MCLLTLKCLVGNIAKAGNYQGEMTVHTNSFASSLFPCSSQMEASPCRNRRQRLLLLSSRKIHCRLQGLCKVNNLIHSVTANYPTAFASRKITVKFPFTTASTLGSKHELKQWQFKLNKLVQFSPLYIKLKVSQTPDLVNMF